MNHWHPQDLTRELAAVAHYTHLLARPETPDDLRHTARWMMQVFKRQTESTALRRLICVLCNQLNAMEGL